MQKRSTANIKNDKNPDDIDISEINSINSKINQLNKLSPLNKSSSFLSNTKNLSNLPFIDKSNSELNLHDHNEITNNKNDVKIFDKYDSDFTKKMEPEIYIKSKTSKLPVGVGELNNEIGVDDDADYLKNKEKKKVGFTIDKIKENIVKKDTNNIDYLKNLREIFKGKNKEKDFLLILDNIKNKGLYDVNKDKNVKANSNENIFNTLESNIITQQAQPKTFMNQKNKKKLSKEFYSYSQFKTNLIGERLMKADYPNLILPSPNKDDDFNLNFEFNNLNYRNLNKEFEVKILEEKIKARQGPTTLRSMRSMKSSDQLLGLKDKFKQARESIEKNRVEAQVAELKAEQEKTVSRNLISFSEQKVKKILRALDFLIIFFVISDVSIAVYSNQRLTSNQFDLNLRIIKEKLELDSEIINLRWVMIVIIFLIEILLLIKYVYRKKLLRLRSLASVKDSFISSKLYKRLLAEMLVLAPFTPPEENSIISGEMSFGEYSYSLDSVILVFKLIKLYYLILFISRFSLWMGRRTNEIARRLKAAVKYNFALKAGLKANPIALMLLCFVFITIFIGIIIKIVEYSFTRDIDKARTYKNYTQRKDENPFFERYVDVFWLVVITMTTVGFGDIYPETHMGRFLCLIASIFGMIFVSLMIVRLGSLVELGTHENKAYHAIQMNVVINQIEIKAKALIRSLFKLKLIKMKKKENFSNGTNELLITKRKIKEFYFYMKRKASDSLYLEDIVVHFSRKIEDDMNNFGFLKYIGEDMNDLIGKINKSQMQIYQSLDLLKAKQNNVSKFIVEINDHMLVKKSGFNHSNYLDKHIEEE